jgi:[ribosomal protein S18]-alanine N-acetyltransferase
MSVDKNEIDDRDDLNALGIVSEATIRPMIKNDLIQVLEIETNSFPTPWSLALFQREMELDFSYIFVLDLDGEIIGYMNYWISVGEVHIMSIAVKESYREAGIGSYILQHSLDEAMLNGGVYAYLEVRIGNSAGHALYRQNGFELVGIRRGYYTDTKEDALIMAKELQADC